MPDLRSGYPCSNCGAAGAKKRCGRCLRAHYCDPACQKVHWQQSHKTECSNEGARLQRGRIPGTQGIVLPRQYDISTELTRFVTVIRPLQIHLSPAICFCCAKLLKCCKTQNNDEQDPLGIFWVETPRDGPHPAELLLGEPGSTGFSVGVGPSVGVAACLNCAHPLRGTRPEARIAMCRKYLDVGALPAELCVSMLEGRLMALVNLFQNPDLSNGTASIAGYLGKVKVSFSYYELEASAFPHLFPYGRGAWSDAEGKMDLLNYTMMRFYSVDPRWRNDSDYIVFSLHRLVAFGIWDVAKISFLPEPIPVTRIEEAISCSIGFRNYAPS